MLSVDGRINRAQFWLRFYIPVLLIEAILGSWVANTAGGALPSFLAGLFGLAVIWPGVAVSVKRLHDRGKSGWWLPLLLIPFVGAIWYLIDVMILDGTKGPNAYGEDPLGRAPSGARPVAGAETPEEAEGPVVRS